MADIFLCQDARQLLANKTVYFIGDSNTRAAYKDTIQLLVCDSLISNAALKSKMEPSFNCDRLVFYGARTNGRNYREERYYEHNGFKALFYFITRCYNDYVESIFTKMQDLPPDVVIYNSCVWDVTRWGAQGVTLYKKNMVTLMDRLKNVLPESCLFIWTTTLPVSSQKIKGGFLIQEMGFLKHTLRFDIMEANLFTSKVVSECGYDVLDLHYHIRWSIDRRTDDGIHWFPHVIRHITNLLLTHISKAWNKPLPGRLESALMERERNSGMESSLGQFSEAEFCLDTEVPASQNYFNFDQNDVANEPQDEHLNNDYSRFQRAYPSENNYSLPWQEGTPIPQFDAEERPVFHFGQGQPYFPGNFVQQPPMPRANCTFPMQNYDASQAFASENYDRAKAPLLPLPNPFNVPPEPRANFKKTWRPHHKRRGTKPKRPFRKNVHN